MHSPHLMQVARNSCSALAPGGRITCLFDATLPAADLTIPALIKLNPMEANTCLREISNPITPLVLKLLNRNDIFCLLQPLRQVKHRVQSAFRYEPGLSIAPMGHSVTQILHPAHWLLVCRLSQLQRPNTPSNPPSGHKLRHQNRGLNTPRLQIETNKINVNTFKA